MSTHAIKFLKHKRVSFELVPYDHQEKGAAFAARATGYPLARTVKTLVADLGGNKTLDAKVRLNQACPFCGQKHMYHADELACPFGGPGKS